MDAGTAVLLGVLIVGLLMVFAGSRSTDRSRSTERLATIDRKLDIIMTHLGLTDTPPEEPDVVQFLQQGKKIEAIKVYRQRTGLGLAESKAAVEKIARERGLS